MRSIYILKPEGMLHTDEILRMIESTGLIVVPYPEGRWSEKVLDALYGSRIPGLRQATYEHLLGEPCRCGFLEGEESLERMIEVVGAEADPAQCGPGTIRALYGIYEPIVREWGNYWRNAIHRSRTVEEANRDFAMLSYLASDR